MHGFHTGVCYLQPESFFGVRAVDQSCNLTNAQRTTHHPHASMPYDLFLSAACGHKEAVCALQYSFSTHLRASSRAMLWGQVRLHKGTFRGLSILSETSMFSKRKTTPVYLGIQAVVQGPGDQIRELSESSKTFDLDFPSKLLCRDSSFCEFVVFSVIYSQISDTYYYSSPAFCRPFPSRRPGLFCSVKKEPSYTVSRCESCL